MGNVKVVGKYKQLQMSMITQFAKH